MEKQIKKAIKATENMMDSIDKDKMIEYQQNRLLPYSEIKRLSMKYFSFQEFMKETVQYGQKMNKIQSDAFTASEILDRIVSYKTKMATKHGKLLKDNPTKKAIIDISDCLTRYENKPYKVATGPFKVDRQSIRMLNVFDGKICLPFTKCFIYTKFFDMFSQVMEITDNEDGTYEGNVWVCERYEKIIQMKFMIQRYENSWGIAYGLSLRQKPLGQVLSNASTILDVISHYDKKDFDLESERMKAIFTRVNDMFGYHVSLMASRIILMLSYLSSYKSKSVYKLSKDESNIYVYSDKVGEEIDNYISENYPEYSSERINGWLVGGNWNFIKPTDYGMDKQGKKIKGLNWNDPYKNHKAEQIVEDNDLTTRLIPIHALERVKERYNVELTQEDLQEIANECLKGHATKLTVRDKFGKLNTAKGKKSCYRVKYKKNTFDVVLSDSHDKNSYRIATFLPKPKDKYPVIDSKDYMEVMTDVLDE